MKKDIQIPEVKDVYMAITHQYNEVFNTNDWNAYLINDKEEPLEMVLIVSHGFDGETKTSVMRHKIDSLPAKSGAKIELLQEEVLKLNNEFKLTFFLNDILHEKTFLFKKNSLKVRALRPVKMLNQRGIIAK